MPWSAESILYWLYIRGKYILMKIKAVLHFSWSKIEKYMEDECAKPSHSTKEELELGKALLDRPLSVSMGPLKRFCFGIRLAGLLRMKVVVVP